jgi:hypothetical protein
MPSRDIEIKISAPGAARMIEALEAAHEKVQRLAPLAGVKVWITYEGYTKHGVFPDYHVYRFVTNRPLPEMTEPGECRCYRLVPVDNEERG